MANPQGQRDTASLLMYSLSAWYQKEQQKQASSLRRKRLSRIKKTHDDEKSLCTSDWSGDLSLDNPHYGSIFMQIREANSESESSCEFVCKTADICQSTIFVTIVLGMFMLLPIAMASIGVKYLTDCPKEPKIPIYMLVGGCFGLLKTMSMLWKQIRSRRYERLDEVDDTDGDTGALLTSRSSRFTEIILSIFLLIWFGFGNYWVLHIYEPHFEPDLHSPSDWCDRTVYMFAFCQILGCYALLGFLTFLALLLSLCHKCTAYFGDKS